MASDTVTAVRKSVSFAELLHGKGDNGNFLKKRSLKSVHGQNSVLCFAHFCLSSLFLAFPNDSWANLS